MSWHIENIENKFQSLDFGAGLVTAPEQGRGGG